MQFCRRDILRIAIDQMRIRIVLLTIFVGALLLGVCGTINVGSSQEPTTSCSKGEYIISPNNNAADPADIYEPGSYLVPNSSCTMWYGISTGNDTGKPDKWIPKTVKLEGGKFYVFFVTGDLVETNPQSFPVQLDPDYSVVWFKRSTQYTYDVCFGDCLIKSEVN
jgi:hypothetical protein